METVKVGKSKINIKQEVTKKRTSNTEAGNKNTNEHHKTNKYDKNHASCSLNPPK